MARSGIPTPRLSGVYRALVWACWLQAVLIGLNLLAFVYLRRVQLHTDPTADTGISLGLNGLRMLGTLLTVLLLLSLAAAAAIRRRLVRSSGNP